MTNYRIQDIIILMDESGSMNSMGDEPLQTVNEFITDQKRVNQNDGSTLSFWKFNTEVTKVLDNVPLSQVGLITDYQPSGLTALNDSIGMAVTAKFLSHKKDDVICMIISDGMENASREYTTEHVKNIIEDLESKHRWKFIYLGTSRDIFTARDMGLERCLSYNPTMIGNLRDVSRAVSDNVANYRSLTATTLDPVTLTFDNLTLDQHQSEPITSFPNTTPLPIPVLRRSTNVTPAFLPLTPDLEPNTPEMIDLPAFELR